ncbi:MAG: hypothetical protein OEZ58_14675 [Gammaproteobacteria bacterium]|nr:hypothetical protein [Gammaproteobacteria bacterium]MDH5730238.1 hypothetical protein [Gammaproteobacteria bacterium]
MINQLFGTGQPLFFFHRGDARNFPENSMQAIVSALNSVSPYVEIDIVDFVDQQQGRLGLIYHCTDCQSILAKSKKIGKYSSLQYLKNATGLSNVVTFIELLDYLQTLEQNFVISLDIKEDNPNVALSFGRWLASELMQRNLESHFIISSPFKLALDGIRQVSENVLIGSIVVRDHPFMKQISPLMTMLDYDFTNRVKLFINFYIRKKIKAYHHDLILFPLSFILQHPEYIDYWRNKRKTDLVGAYQDSDDFDVQQFDIQVLQKLNWVEMHGRYFDEFQQVIQQPKLYSALEAPCA